MTTYTITVPTIGSETYEVTAASAEAAVARLKAADYSLRQKWMTEQNTGDWADGDDDAWEVEAGDD